ncbi:MAG TPA: glucose 1-dehydrogenase [Syntrophorhabdaceae bacterium]|nr:glucose 1-dehydrogenase [Syntrophorhabdaceae bacterium]
MKLKNKVALITGAGSGIGRASALLFAGEGARVIVADIASEPAEEVVRIIRERGGEAIFAQADVASSAEIASMMSLAENRYGRLDILFNNAGFISKPLDEITEEEWRRGIDVMLTGPFLASKLAIPIMRKQGGGNILNTGSIGSLSAGGGKSPLYNLEKMSPAYTAAKGGLLLLTRFLARVLAHDHIRVNCICPGSVDTSILASADRDYDMSLFSRTAHIPMGRLGSAEEIAAVALFLVSDDASYITGVGLPIDGGVLA